MKIFRFEQRDKEEYFELAQAFYHSPAVLHAVPHEFFERTFDEIMRSNVYVDGFLLKNDDQQTMGYALVSKSFSSEMGGMEFWVEELSVLPAFRGQGVGTDALALLESYYPNWARFRLEVEQDNIRAVKLYQRLGYEKIPYLQMGKQG